MVLDIVVQIVNSMHTTVRHFRRRRDRDRKDPEGEKTMTRETTNAGKLGKLQKLSMALAANSGDLPHLQGSLTQLATLLTQAQEAAKQQAAFIAGKQEASKQLNTFMTEGERLATVLQLAVKQHYGIRAEKLAEFGLQPFRGRSRKEKPVPPVPVPPVPVPVTPHLTAAKTPDASPTETA
jgi:hypothetical protein